MTGCLTQDALFCTTALLIYFGKFQGHIKYSIVNIDLSWQPAVRFSSGEVQGLS